MSSQPQRPGNSPGRPQQPVAPVPPGGPQFVPGPTRPRPQVVPGRDPESPSPPSPRPAPIPPGAQPDVDPREPRFRRFQIPVSTTDELPGFEITGLVGVVVGVATRPRDLAHHPDMAFVNASARQDAIDAMVSQAISAGADGVTGLRFDGGKVSENVSEVTAYGTAVRLRRVVS